MTASPLYRPRGALVAERYLLGEPLGAGGMGVVYRAEQVVLGRSVAIKFLHDALAGDAATVARFQGEARVAARLSHPHSVAVFDYGTDDGTPFLVMEHVRGRSLRRLVEDRPLAIGRAIALCRQILAALGAAHAAGIVHADIKPDNVLVEHRRTGERVKLIDFGLARDGHAADGGPGQLGGEACVAGTPEYMAPEVILGERPGPAADLYAVGVLLYELLTGVTPFGGGPSIEIFVRHVRDELVPPSKRLPECGVPRELEEVVTRALAKDPGRRHRSAAELGAALAAVDGATTATARLASALHSGSACRPHACPKSSSSTASSPSIRWVAL